MDKNQKIGDLKDSANPTRSDMQHWKSENKYRLIVETAKEIIFTCDIIF